ncbi:membrane protein insertion efficiency factor YidD [Staphylococcus capitis]|nr:membrane protein insertion efficiency factor YidD [Staphylococcus capitis]MDH8730810.1 membrane protein insertion efficiency factor YidD [Staphylococcus capitis]MDH8923630.1 membrane protein insertion efficiency factor YidD [Staphylococcus capitis]MDH9962691.1 membrane protein insertion efficiency factor YidD [Staphylococcus capitis]
MFPQNCCYYPTCLHYAVDVNEKQNGF